ncbi:hypothetical protein FN846DRAFT_782513 [Sphaerosporella brunnea]|uniref:DUF676 domain-containing protein n=1 Tax=Sphaerosporella brunnea TaxID=1250544 RepID=A0A5J5EP25_9PEZI|nr:hypothetical protein FN846DRAFT_782512 [Sphaerosporella brunnea]KAA8899107.1 hypothetical protein FN846DRAFT_782513 [Sphaerosporella brunnea]
MPKNSLALKPPSTSRSRSTPSISVASVGQQGLSTPSPVPQPKSPRTLRLSLIPTSVDNNQLRKFLGGLEYESQPPKENILALSLAPFVDWLVATVSFSQEPLIFLRCTTGRSLSLPLPPELGGSTINVDCDFYGITPLYHPPSKPTYDVIAVSGLSSHAFGSWKSPQNSHVMWLRDILQLDFPDFRVLTWGYESDLRDGTNDSTIADFSRQLLTAVHTARDDDSEGKTRPVVFVGHDLGGLIIKHALVEAAQGSSEDDQAIMRCCVGIFLFGVPNRGLNNGYLLSLVKGRKNEALVQNLMESSALLNNLHIAFQRSYKSSLKYCFVASFFETRDTNTVELPDGSWSRSGEPIRVVTRESATGFAPEEEAHNQIAIVADHSKLVQFKGRDDANYLHVRAKLKEMVRRTPKILQMRTGDGI